MNNNEIEQTILMREELRKDAINSVILGLVEAFEKDNQDKFGAIAEDLTQGVFKGYFDSPEDFHLFFMFPLEQIIEMAYRLSMTAKGQPGNSDMDIQKQISLLADVTMRFSTYHNIIGSMITATEGTTCYVDKLHWVIRSYCKWIRTGKMPDMSIDVKCYWKPYFGSAEDWLALCEGVYFLGRERIGKNALEDLTRAYKTLFIKYQQAKDSGVYKWAQEAYAKERDNCEA